MARFYSMFEIAKTNFYELITFTEIAQQESHCVTKNAQTKKSLAC